MNPLNLVLDIAAAKRLTRLIVDDEITRPIREHHSVTKHEKLSYLLNCPYCVSVYTSALVTFSSMLLPKASRPVIYLLALAEAQAQLTEYEAQRAALTENYGPPL